MGTRSIAEVTTEALEATAGQPVEVQAAAVGAAIGPPPPEAVSWLWKALVVGLLALAGASLIGVVFAVVDGDKETSPDVLVTLFTSSLTGLIGLFVKSPTQA